jgi:hypothetical protein
MVIDFSMEQKSLGGNTTYMKAGATQLRVFFNDAGLESKLAGTEGSRVAARAGADNGNVINRVWQVMLPCTENLEKANRRL